MAIVELEALREKRIANEVLVETETDEDRATAWYYYLDGKVTFPFQATLDGDDDVEVISLSVEEDCLDEMKMEVRHSDSFGEEPFTALVMELEPLDADDDTTEAMEDWQYWLERGNRLSEPEDDETDSFSESDLDDVDEGANFNDEE